LNRSELIEQALRNEHQRIALRDCTTQAVPALDVDVNADKVYRANRDAKL
jgi:hypothetical protein